MKKSVLSVVLSSVLSIVLISTIVSEPVSASVNNHIANHSFKEISFHCTSVDDRVETSQFTYNDGFFFQDATALNGDLAKMSVALAASAYDTSYLNTILDQMEFTILSDQENAYNKVNDATLKDNNFNHVAYTVATKEIDGYTVYCVPIKGTSANAEWYSNFDLGDGDTHKGFEEAAQEVYNAIKHYITSDANHTIILLTGHSRGAAVANLVETWFCEKTAIPNSQIFGFNFACPAVSRHVNNNLNNIRNYNNPGDLIALLPLEKWGFKRNGIDINTYPSIASKKNIYEQFNRIIGRTCTSQDTSKNYLNIMEPLFPTQASFNRSEFKLLFRLVGWGLGNGDRRTTKDTLSDVVSYDNYEGAIILGIKAFLLNNPSYAVNKGGRALVSLISSGHSHYSELIQFIDDTKTSVSQMSDEQYNAFINDFDSFIFQNSTIISQIENCCEIEISSYWDLISCRSALNSLTTEGNYFVDETKDFLDLLYTESGTIKDRIWDAHNQFYYVLWMNTVFCGFEGWKDNDSSFGFGDIGYNNIYSIGYKCFNNCVNMKSLFLSESLRKIGSNAFYNCSGLTGEIDLPPDLHEIETNAFAGCYNLSGELAIPSGITELGAEAFSGCSGLTGEVVIPEGITEIQQGTFKGCSGISKLTLHEGVDIIGKSAFEGCSGISKLTLHEGVDIIGQSAFEGCSGITEITIPCTTTYVSNGNYEYNAFKGCKSVDTVNITGKGEICDQEGIYNYGYRNYMFTPWYISEAETLRVNISEGITRIGNNAFIDCENLVNISIPSTVTSIGKNAYKNCSKMEGQLSLPQGLVSIGSNAFYGCSGLKGDINLPTGLTELGAEAFSGCSGLTGEVVIPEGITEVQQGTFKGCTGISKLTLPISILTIDNYAFYGCSRLYDVYYLGFLADWNKITIGNNNDSLIKAKLHCKENEYTITIDSVSNGKVIVSQSIANAGDEIIITVTPDNGYVVESIKINNEVITGNKFKMPASDVTITVTFKKAEYKITVSDAIGGTVSVSQIVANAGEEITITSAPHDGYSLGTVSVKDSDDNVIDVAEGKFIMPTNNVTVTVDFIPIDYSVSIENSVNGTIEVSQEVANVGDKIKVTAKPDDSYMLDSLFVDGVSIEGNSFEMPARDVTVSATFKKAVYKVNVIDSEGGTVTVSPSVAGEGDEVTITAKAAEGYEFDGFVVKDPNNASIDVVDGRFTMPAGNVTVSASFNKLVKDYELTIKYDSDETTVIGIESTSKAHAGDKYAFTVVANDGYRIVEVRANDSILEVEDDGSYKTSQPESDLVIQIICEKKSDPEPVSEGWVTDEDGNKFYYENGELVTKWLELNGVKYYLDPENDGRMVVGWFKVDGSWYYFDKTTGSMVTGWKKISKKWYYLDPETGVMATGWLTVGGKKYYLNKTSGAMITGWKTISSKKYYFNTSTGAATVGGKKIGKYYYLFDSKGIMQKSGWKKDSKGNTYYLKKDGKAYTKKWAKKSKKWYYFGSNGRMVKGKSLKIGKKTYKFKSDGVCKNK